MLLHRQIWAAIDALAASRGLTTSGLAKRAGLDPTAFNRSKRATPDGRLRWPGTESLAKALDAAGATFEEFAGLVSGRGGGRPRRLPLLGLSAASIRRFDAAGRPLGGGWDEIAFPGLDDDSAYALEIQGSECLPLYRDGDVIVVSPAAAVRRGDRIVTGLRTGDLSVGVLKRRTANTLEIGALGARGEDRVFSLADIAWTARIVWASQ
jgi:phage repressor protein C with HTH and peptisase S24 domain